MTKADIAQLIARATGLTQTDTAAAIDGFIEAVTQALEEGDHVEIRGFGTFKVRPAPGAILERAPTWRFHRVRRLSSNHPGICGSG